jgi:Glyoxalase superfamily protein/Clp amino terminal domain, pathogenicity island component/Bacterial translation initiation factor IF-2 associated region
MILVGPNGADIHVMFLQNCDTLGPDERVSNEPCRPLLHYSKDDHMRDFRDAEAMATTLRAALAAKGLEITVSQSLELIAEIFGVADWSTLAAAIRKMTIAADATDAARPSPAEDRAAMLMFSRALEQTLHRALACANQRDHEFATLEHLLLALTEDAEASALMKDCKVDLVTLRDHLTSYIDNELKSLAIPHGHKAKPTAGFQRVIQRAVIHAQSSGGAEVTGANVLVAIFAERESHAAFFLQEQNMTRDDAVNAIKHGVESGVVRQSFSHGRTKPVVVEKVKRRAPGPARRKSGSSKKK